MARGLLYILHTPNGRLQDSRNSQGELLLSVGFWTLPVLYLNA
jgi:hypothetical protein